MTESFRYTESGIMTGDRIELQAVEGQTYRIYAIDILLTMPTLFSLIATLNNSFH
jgi:hypothetical protein